MTCFPVLLFCTSRQHLLEPLAFAVRAAPSVVECLPGEVCQGQCDFRCFLKDVQPDIEKEVSF